MVKTNGYKKANLIAVLVTASVLILSVLAGIIFFGADCKGEINRAHTRIDDQDKRVQTLEKHLNDKMDDFRTEQRAISRKVDRIIELQLQKGD